MVDHQVESDVVARGERGDVVPGSEAGIDLLVGERREATVTRRRERRQDVDAAEETREVLVEHVGQGSAGCRRGCPDR